MKKRRLAAYLLIFSLVILNSSSVFAKNKEQQNNTIIIQGVELGINNSATQEALDKRGKELINWSSSIVENKLVNGEQGVYLAVHRNSYGHLVRKAKEIKFKDINGQEKIYKLSETLGPFKWSENPPNSEVEEYLDCKKGDAIAIQTCVGANSTYKIFVFR